MVQLLWVIIPAASTLPKWAPGPMIRLSNNSSLCVSTQGLIVLTSWLIIPASLGLSPGVCNLVEGSTGGSTARWWIQNVSAFIISISACFLLHEITTGSFRYSCTNVMPWIGGSITKGLQFSTLSGFIFNWIIQLCAFFLDSREDVSSRPVKMEF